MVCSGNGGRRPGGWDGEERRSGSDRRSARERRDRGGHQPLSARPRSYAFREFRDRRSPQDRRLYIARASAWGGWPRRHQDMSDAFADGYLRLTPAELAALLSDD